MDAKENRQESQALKRHAESNLSLVPECAEDPEVGLSTMSAQGRGASGNATECRAESGALSLPAGPQHLHARVSHQQRGPGSETKDVGYTGRSNQKTEVTVEGPRAWWTSSASRCIYQQPEEEASFQADLLQK